MKFFVLILSGIFFTSCSTVEDPVNDLMLDAVADIENIDDYGLNDNIDVGEQPDGYVSRFDGTFQDLLEITPLDNFVADVEVEENPEIDFIDEKEVEEAVQMFGQTDLRPRVFYVAREVANIRDKASSTGEIVRVLKAGQKVIGTVRGAWAKVKGAEEYIPLRDLSLSPLVPDKQKVSSSSGARAKRSKKNK